MNKKRVLCIALCYLVVCVLSAPFVAAQDQSVNSNSVQLEPATVPPAPKNEVKIDGDAIISPENGLHVVPTVIDEELHNTALILRAIGVPLISAGETLIGVSIAPWAVWVILQAGSGLLSSDIGGLLDGIDITINDDLNNALLATSIGLTATGLALLIGGGVTKSIGDDYRERSFAEVR